MSVYRTNGPLVQSSIDDTMNWFQNSMSDYNHFYIKAYQNQNFMVTEYTNLTRTVRGSDYSPAIELSEQKDKLVTATGDTEKYFEKQSLVKFCLLVLKILSGNEILTSIKGRNSVANLRNLTLYIPNLDIINVNVYTKFG